MSNEDKEWIKAAKPANGPVVVTVTRQRGNLSAKVSVKAYSEIKGSATEARQRVLELLDDLAEVVGT